VSETAEATGILRPSVCTNRIMSVVNCTGKLCLCISSHKSKSAMSH